MDIPDIRKTLQTLSYDEILEKAFGQLRQKDGIFNFINIKKSLEEVPEWDYLLYRDDGLFLNRGIRPESYIIWWILNRDAELKDVVIPVSPILETPGKGQRVYRNTTNIETEVDDIPESYSVYTRFCGLSLEMLEGLTSKMNVITDLVKLGYETMQRYQNAFDDSHIYHGHLHEGNITLEFIKKSFLLKNGIDPETLKPIDPNQSTNINNLKFDNNNYSFDPLHCCGNEEWIPVFRVIDIDLARASQSSFYLSMAEKLNLGDVENWSFEEIYIYLKAFSHDRFFKKGSLKDLDIFGIILSRLVKNAKTPSFIAREFIEQLHKCVFTLVEGRDQKRVYIVNLRNMPDARVEELEKLIKCLNEKDLSKIREVLCVEGTIREKLVEDYI